MTMIVTNPKAAPRVVSRYPRRPSAFDYSAVHAATHVADVEDVINEFSAIDLSKGTNEPITSAVFEDRGVVRIVRVPQTATVVTYRRTRDLTELVNRTPRTVAASCSALSLDTGTDVQVKPVKPEPVEKADTIARTSECRRFSNLTNQMFINDMGRRGGEAVAEHVAAYTGFDHRIGQKRSNSLKGTAAWNKTLPLRAGTSAEIIMVARGNARADLCCHPVRMARADDTAGYGKDHPSVDVVFIVDGRPLPQQEIQVKFTSDYRNEINGTVRNKSGKGRYRKGKLALPSEQVSAARNHCFKAAKSCQEKADQAQAEGRHDDAAALNQEATAFRQQAEKIVSSKVTREEANYAAENPLKFTRLECIRSTHQASMAALTGSVATTLLQSSLSNISAAINGKKDAKDAAISLTIDVAKAGATTYGTTFVSSLAKGMMQQSERTWLNHLGNANAPARVITGIMTYGKTAYRYANNDISAKDAIDGIAEKTTGTAFSVAGAAVFQIIIPIPVIASAVGAWAGGTVGTTLYHAVTKPESNERKQMKLLAVSTLYNLINNLVR